MTKNKTETTEQDNAEAAFVADLKRKHGEIYVLNFEDGKKCYLKTPDRKTLKFAATIAQSNPLEYAEVILNNCFVGGDEDIKTNNAYFLSATSKIEQLIEVKQSELKKL